MLVRRRAPVVKEPAGGDAARGGCEVVRVALLDSERSREGEDEGLEGPDQTSTDW